jgi:hypothetical protein
VSSARSSKLFASIGVLGAAASCSGLATFADPVAASASLHVDSRRPRAVAVNRVLRIATAIAPGDRVSRTLVLKASGRKIRRLRLAVRARPPSLLTARAQGLRLTVRRCPRKWSRKGSGYSCSGRTRTVLGLSPVLGRHKLAHVATRRGKRLFLLLTLTLPKNAGNTFQHERTKLVYTFTRR